MRCVLRLSVMLMVAFASMGAGACSSIDGRPTDEQFFERASSVFVAHIAKTEEKVLRFSGWEAPVPIVEGTFRVIETLKGTPPQDGIVRDLVLGIGNCSLGLLVGHDYLFFINNDKSEESLPKNFVLITGGSRALPYLDREEPKRLLEMLRRLQSLKKNEG